MSRGKKRIERPMLPDIKYGSLVLAKLINLIMLDGKKEVSEKIVYEALEIAGKKIIEKYSDISKGVEELIMSIGPTVETKAKRIGGANYQIPIAVSDSKRMSLGMKMLVEAARNKKGAPMHQNLASEMIAALEEKGEAFKKKINIQKMAAANRAYAHLA